MSQKRIPYLFKPLKLRSLESRNRLMLPAMCQYSADQEGVGNDWHIQHYGARALGGGGIIMAEATAVVPEGRISPWDLGLWNDRQADFLARLAKTVTASGSLFGIQLAHAGRKGSSVAGWEKRRFVTDAEGGFDLKAPSAAAYGPDYREPAALTVTEIQGVIEKFKEAALRALKAGVQIIELHGAHGYLIHQFLSPVSNLRTDSYGGSLENRARFLLETVRAVRAVWPATLPLFVRLSVTDFLEGGFTAEECVIVGRWLKETGEVDLIDCSSGGLSPEQDIPDLYPGYMISLARKIRKEVGIATGAVGLIRTAELAEAAVGSGSADLVLVGRAWLADPVWPYRAAKELGFSAGELPLQYQRASL